MPKELLTGSLEEQCAFLYQMAQEKMEAGNYTGAVYALREIVAHKPDYADAARLLKIAQERKAAQRNLLLFSLLGAVAGVGVGTFLQISNDFVLLALAAVGLLVGYCAATLARRLFLAR